MVQRIELTRGKSAVVDDEDYDRLCQYRWRATLIGNTWYATRSFRLDGKKMLIYMHREILHASEFIDHKDHDGLNNIRSNLRQSTNSQNQGNSRKRTGTSSIYKGVTWRPSRQRWEASIRLDGKKKYLGLFVDEMEAAETYAKAAKEKYGEFANPYRGRRNHADREDHRFARQRPAHL